MITSVSLNRWDGHTPIVTLYDVLPKAPEVPFGLSVCLRVSIHRGPYIWVHKRWPVDNSTPRLPDKYVHHGNRRESSIRTADLLDLGTGPYHRPDCPVDQREG